MTTQLYWTPLAPSDFRDTNSATWKNNARVDQANLRKEIGDVPYSIFAEAVWPDETIDRLTWQEIKDQAWAAYCLAARGERDLTVLIDAAKAVECSPEAKLP
jgi:hypothetical protein